MSRFASPNLLPTDARISAPASAAASSAAEAEALGALPAWNLAALYAGMDDPAFAADMKKAEALCQDFTSRWRGKLDTAARSANASAELEKAIAEYDALEDRLGRLMSFADLTYSTCMTDSARAKFNADARDRLTAMSSGLLFFTLELNRIDDALLESAMASGPLKRYAPWLRDIRMDKPFQLEDRVEQLFHEKSITGYSSWSRLFEETMASLRFDVDGKSLPLAQTLNLMQDPHEDVRHKAAEAIGATLTQNLRIFTMITNTLAKDKEISDRWRGFEDIADSRHLSNRVERDVVNALVSAVTNAYPRLSHRYYKLKAKWFGKDALDYWDRNAPMPNVPAKTWRWEEARDLILDAYGKFNPHMAQIAGQFFERQWIDAPVREGKSPGAFAHPTVPSANPYVLVNFLGKPRDVMTLAHELGHGVHQCLASPHGALMANTPLTLAETASVFGEMLTFRKLLTETKDKAQRRTLLASKVEDMLNTVVRQIAFYSFERKVHAARREAELTSEQICDLWMSVQAESLGPAIKFGPGYETWWAYIPHFIHSPFYVYAYAFGDCLVNSLYGVYQKAEEGFAEKYLALLAAGGTKHHSELLAPFGLDARDPAFWDIGLSMIEGFIKELEEMGDPQFTG
ncbi:MAG: M3 family oligoendopeptidase [Alphaproteobacteria bacterium]|nr:M3 family oligoendopeptidase [Alphaproteobacteria bacterium]